MNKDYKYIGLFVVALLVVVGCSSFSNSFIGEWSFGSFNMEFNKDKTFTLSIGKAVSVNVDGTYEYNKDTLILDIEGDNKYPFSYEFKDGDKMLILKPQTESGYINSTIELTRQ